jgi:single-strand DNA-binding protein
MNSITIAGQLGRDAEVRFLPDGEPVSNFSIADSQGKDRMTIWWNCSLFGKRAQSLSPYLVKGQSVTVSGNVSQREYTDKNGQKRISTDIRVIEVALQGGRKEGNTDQAAKPKQDASGFDEMESSIPF